MTTYIRPLNAPQAGIAATSLLSRTGERHSNHVKSIDDNTPLEIKMNLQHGQNNLAFDKEVEEYPPLKKQRLSFEMAKPSSPTTLATAASSSYMVISPPLAGISTVTLQSPSLPLPPDLDDALSLSSLGDAAPDDDISSLVCGDDKMDMETTTKHDEDDLLDEILDLFDDYEESLLWKHANQRKQQNQQQQVKLEKLRLAMYKVLTLWVQSDIRLCGETTNERIQMMQKVSQLFMDGTNLLSRGRNKQRRRRQRNSDVNDDNQQQQQLWNSLDEILLTKQTLLPPCEIRFITTSTDVPVMPTTRIGQESTITDSHHNASREHDEHNNTGSWWIRKFQQLVKVTTQRAQEMVERRISCLSSNENINDCWMDNDNNMHDHVQRMEGLRDVVILWYQRLEYMFSTSTTALRDDQEAILQGVLVQVTEQHATIDSLMWDFCHFIHLSRHQQQD